VADLCALAVLPFSFAGQIKLKGNMMLAQVSFMFPFSRIFTGIVTGGFSRSEKSAALTECRQVGSPFPLVSL
jgi:hypothetical protein